MLTLLFFPVLSLLVNLIYVIGSMAGQVYCENPRIIMNPSLGELLSRYGFYIFRGQMHKYVAHQRALYDLDYKIFSVKRQGITHDDLENCKVVDQSTGEMFPIYLEVGCGHCCLCKQAKINAFVERCKLETMQYTSRPWFVTLTYSDDNLPKDGVRVRDAQLFLKRFRVNLARAGFANKIRYVIVGEYGRNTHRPHYHAIIWNIPSFDHVAYVKVSDLLDKSWHQGYTMHRLVDPTNDKAFYYTSKYLKKDCKPPYYAVRSFITKDGACATEIARCNRFFVTRAEAMEVSARTIYAIELQNLCGSPLIQSLNF